MDVRELLSLPFGSVVRINTFTTEDVEEAGDFVEVQHPSVEYFIRSGEFCVHDFISAETSSEADAQHLVGAPGLTVVWTAPTLTSDHLKAIHEL